MSKTPVSLDQICVRPVRETDLSGLMALIEELADPITTIPREPQVMVQRIHLSLRSFYPAISYPGQEQYIFILEDESVHKIIGACSIIARVGGYEPFYTYKVVKEVVRHEPLQINKTLDVLHLHASYDGATEVGMLFLHPKYRRSGLGRLLSLSRFLFIAAFPNRFRQSVIAELRGYLDDDGHSPFWDVVGNLFFERAFDEADFLSGLGNKDFIRDLMPRHPIYVPMLPESARKMIGRVHRDTEPAKRMLEGNGFKWTGEVDIFDAGPLLECPTNEIATIRNSQVLTIANVEDELKGPAEWIATNERLDYRACLAHVRIDGATCAICSQVATVLNVSTGEKLRIAPARSR